VRLHSRRDLLAAGMKGNSSASPASHFVQSVRPRNLASVGWSWEGQGYNAPMAPSVYGAGEGAAYFGLNKAIFMYHPNNELAMEKLRSLQEVVCDITKWKQVAIAYGGAELHYDSRPITVLEEAENVARLASSFTNVKGAYFDDMLAKSDYGALSSEEYTSVRDTLRRAGSELKLWAVVYPSELDGKDWAGFKPQMDVINLRIPAAKDLPNLNRYVNKCREVFPGKALVLTGYLWDYSTKSTIPQNLLKQQWESIAKYLEDGKIAGYVVFAAFLIDGNQKEARWVKDFIAAH
jgi:hypothetical protein